MIRTALCPDALDPLAALAPLHAMGSGGMASFTGHARPDDGVVALFIEHHPELAVQQLADIAAAAQRRWSLTGVLALHRIGHVPCGAPIVCVAACADHRAAALDATAFMIDRLKCDIMLWKQERLADGHSRWVEQRRADVEKSARWVAQRAEDHRAPEKQAP